MRTIESEATTVIPLPADEATRPAVTAGNYEAVRFNAMKHGILSRLAVLAHEDHAEFADLLAALVEEHRPAGMTARHLVEELAAIIWRKRRVLLAEGAAINRGLRNVAHSKHDSPIPAAAPFERGLSSDGADLPDLLTATPADIAERQRGAALDLDATRKAAAILRKGGANAYDKARRALRPDSRAWWDESIADEEYPPTADGLARFIAESLEPVCVGVAQEARFASEIKAQTLGEGLQMHRLEKLSRYETHLDRKFERTLAMLLKLKELRGG